MLKQKRIKNLSMLVALAATFLTVALTLLSITASPVFAQASNPRVNNEHPERAKVTGQVKRIHPHALKLILQGKTDEAIAYLESASTSKVNPEHTKMLLDIAHEKPGAWKFDAATWPWERTLPNTSLKKDAPRDSFTIAFGGGSGYVPEHERMWDTIRSIDPRAVLLLGDFVYIDDPETPEMQRFHYYRRQSQPEWAKLAKQVPIYGIYDDHDFTTNDGWGGPAIDEPAWKRDVWNLFKENWDNPYYGGGDAQPGCWFDFRIGDVHFIMLDGRYYRESPKTENPSMLGPVQMEWLKKTLTEKPATFTIICSNVPMAKDVKPGSKDTWDGYDGERQSIYQFIADQKIPGVVILSADRHRSDAYKIDTGIEGMYPLYEFSSSRLTNQHVHRLIESSLFGYNEKQSYGRIDFDLKADDPTVKYTIINIDGEEIHTLQVKLSELQFNKDQAKTSAYTHLAPTPPMGWNSWNIFAKEIDEAKIKAAADAMVSSGMRDAGYEYLVLDDAWMAAERDENGALQADPEKFPKGMKDIGDYIHSKGLKFGIYEDRADKTCQTLPGSFEHEQIDMATFASWGVDYIKLDSCYAEWNGRLSSEDYAIYRKYIEETGRPMVLSISDFGNAAWVWGGKESSQLWRTGWDIRSRMSSVYNCADTSAGSHRSHPAFNGLWQFSGPGYWNDPDMLQVGNFTIQDEKVKDAANKAHFGLWCILAAPLMAGNDMPNMSDSARDTLTAPEVIAVNQDPRGVQGYKVFIDDTLEVYNKPLADGTTAVLLLNKGTEKSDITVTWEMIGLSGKQPVRDLWQRKDLGKFKGSFTAKDLGQHGSMMLKIGKKGKPLPMPDPMPLEKYTVTRKGITSLSDLYYAWKEYTAPVYNTTFDGNPITIDGKTYPKGFGCKSKSTFMFAGTEMADHFKGTVALDPSYQGKNQGRFRIYHEDYFGNRVLWDSGLMTKDTPAQEIDIELQGYNCLMLTFVGQDIDTGKQVNDVLGVFADPRVIANN